MTSGKLLRWRVDEGACLPENGADPVCDVLPENLVDDELGGTDDLEAPVLEIESHEEGFLARILVAEGEEAQPDVAIAVIAENESDIERLREAYSGAADGSLMVEPATFAWQAYLGAGQASRQCSNS